MFEAFFWNLVVARNPTFQRHFTLLYVATSFKDTQLPSFAYFVFSAISRDSCILRVRSTVYTDMEAN